MHWRSFWHLGPNQKESLMDAVINQLNGKNVINYFWETKWISDGFGKRISRKTLCLNGQILPGEHEFSCSLKIKL